MPRATSIEVNAHLVPSFVPRTLHRRSHTSVFGGFNIFELKLRPHRRFSHDMHNPFDIASGLAG
jgi:hypothetical protein